MQISALWGKKCVLISVLIGESLNENFFFKADNDMTNLLTTYCMLHIVATIFFRDIIISLHAFIVTHPLTGAQ